MSLLHLPQPDLVPALAGSVTSTIEVARLPSASDRFLLAAALLSPFGWAAGAVAMRRRRALSELTRG